MGYYTNFELTIHEGTASMFEVKTALDNVMGVPSDESIFDHEIKSLTTSGACKWYDHDEDCAAMSKHFPGVVFKLHGEGEEQGDIWEAYYKDGLCQICRALRPAFPPFDSTQLKSVSQAQAEDIGLV
jgi:hypothetical protein